MTDVNSKERDDTEAWKQVHRQLVLAITMTKDKINAEKGKMRFLLEEIYLNLETDGTLVPASKWSAPNHQKQVSPRSRKKKRSEDGGGAEFSAAKASRKKANQKKRPASVSNGDKVDAVTSTATSHKKRIRISTKKTKSSKALKKEPIVDDNDGVEFAAQQQHLEEAPDAYDSYETSINPLAQTEAEPSSMSMYMPDNQDALYPPAPVHRSSYEDFSYSMDLNATAAAVAVASQVAATAMANFQFLASPSPTKEEEVEPESQSTSFKQLLNYEGDVNTGRGDADTDNDATTTLFSSSTLTTDTTSDPNCFSAGASESLLQQMLQQHGGCDEDEDDPF